MHVHTDWVSSLHPQVLAAIIAALAGVVGVVSTAAVAIFGYRNAQRVATTTLDGQRRHAINERRFGAYEDTVKYLLHLTRRRPESYGFWPEMSERPGDAELPVAVHATIEAQIMTWAPERIRALWTEFEAAEHTTDVSRNLLRFLKGQEELVPAEPVTAATIAQHEDSTNTKANEAYRARTALIQAIRDELRADAPPSQRKSRWWNARGEQPSR